MQLSNSSSFYTNSSYILTQILLNLKIFKRISPNKKNRAKIRLIIVLISKELA